MANNKFQHKRSTVSGVVPTTGDLSAGELGINLADKKLFTANSSAVFELGSNLTSIYVGNTTSALTVNSTIVTIPTTIALSANGSNGTSGQVLTSNGTGVYWNNNRFTNLTDAPGSYSGAGGYLVAVNPGATGLVFANDIELDELVHTASIAPSIIAADSVTVYVTASGTSPNREVAYKIKNELNQEIIISSILV
jgi:hypothetical protein